MIMLIIIFGHFLIKMLVQIKQIFYHHIVDVQLLMPYVQLLTQTF